ncbi:MAG: hypothetical protein ABI696_14125 [Rubrivivax sp.]
MSSGYPDHGLTPLRRRRGALATLLCLAAATLPGCGSTPSATPPAPSPTPPPAGRPPPLVVERLWLQSWFKGTPVRITQGGDGPIDIDVPIEFCFERGRSEVRPALIAVLDKVAESLRRVPEARLDRVAAPADAAAAPALALQRATRVRNRVRAGGVAAARLASPSAASTAAVQLRISLGPDSQG